MTKNPAAKNTKKMSTKLPLSPQSIVAQFSDYTPCLAGENEEEFSDFQLRCIKDIQPQGAIEEVWLLDFINYTWEAIRLRRLKVALLRSNHKKGYCYLFVDFGEIWEGAEDLAEGWSEGDKDAVEFTERHLKQHGLDASSIDARALQYILKDFERLDKLIASYEFRRDKVIGQLEQRRELLGRRAREFAANVSDVEYENIPQGQIV